MPFQSGNGYKALHISAIAPNSRKFEVQIKTIDMENVAKYGNANHAAKYKPRTLDRNVHLKVPRYAVITHKDNDVSLRKLSFNENFQYFYNIPYKNYLLKASNELGHLPDDLV